MALNDGIQCYYLFIWFFFPPDLGPLDPDWFEVLTSQTLTNEENAFNQDDLCPNQEGHFKPTSDSLLFSTPKVFRHCQVVSPENEGEQSFADGHGNVY